jgi:threonine aldolase
MASYVAHAQLIAQALSAIDGVDVAPDPPQTNMMHLHLRTNEAAVSAGIRRLATEQQVWAFSGSGAAETPGIRAMELTVGDATLGFTPGEVANIVRELLPRA